MDRDYLHAEMRAVALLFETLPEWNDTAKLRGKIQALRNAIDTLQPEGDTQAVCAALGDLDDALRRLHEADPLTVLVQRVLRWRETMKQS